MLDDILGIMTNLKNYVVRLVIKNSVTFILINLKTKMKGDIVLVMKAKRPTLNVPPKYYLFDF